MAAHNHLLTPFAGHLTPDLLTFTNAKYTCRQNTYVHKIILKRSAFIKFFKFHYVAYLYFSADILKIQSRSGVRFRSHLCFNALVTLLCNVLLSIQRCPCNFLQITIELYNTIEFTCTFIGWGVCVHLSVCLSELSF